MKSDKSILDTIDHRDGMTVPEGYFDDFIDKMEKMLPETAFEQSQSEAEDSRVLVGAAPTRWQRVRPYVYMAAMFAGAWCMLKMFSLISPATGNAFSFDSDPVIAEAIGNEQFIDEYFLGDYNEYDLYEDMMYVQDIDPDHYDADPMQAEDPSL